MQSQSKLSRTASIIVFLVFIIIGIIYVIGISTIQYQSSQEHWVEKPANAVILVDSDGVEHIVSQDEIDRARAQYEEDHAQ